MSDFAIQVKHLDKMYKLYNKPSDRLRETLGMKVPVKEHYALRDVSFDVKRGETVRLRKVHDPEDYNRSSESHCRRGGSGRKNICSSGAWRRFQS